MNGRPAYSTQKGDLSDNSRDGHKDRLPRGRPEEPPWKNGASWGEANGTLAFLIEQYGNHLHETRRLARNLFRKMGTPFSPAGGTVQGDLHLLSGSVLLFSLRLVRFQRSSLCPSERSGHTTGPAYDRSKNGLPLSRASGMYPRKDFTSLDLHLVSLSRAGGHAADGRRLRQKGVFP